MSALVWLALTAAHAQEEGCGTVFTAADLLQVIEEVDRLIERADVDRAQQVLRKAQLALPCSETLVDRRTLATFGRRMAVVGFYQQDEVAAVRWARLARLADPDNDREGMPPALSDILDEAGDPPMGRLPSGKGLVFPKGGAIFLNGRLLQRPETKIEVPYLVQVFDSTGHPVRQYWQDGSAFPDDMVGPPAPMRNPRFFNPMTETLSPRGSGPKPVRDGPGPPIAELVVGSALVVVGAALYGVAGLSKAQLSCDARVSEGCPTTSDELTRLRSTANLATVGAGVLVIGGVGVGVGGVLLEGAPMSISIRGRF